MALGGIILYLAQGLGMSTPGSASQRPVIVASGSDFSVELRVRFPLSGDGLLPPSEVSGALWTLSSGSSYVSAWYEKAAVASQTGNIYVTSSLGRLQLTSASLFDDHFYNISFVQDFSDGTWTLGARRHFDGRSVYSTSSVVAATLPTLSYTTVEVGSSVLSPSRGQFWAQEFRLWNAALGPIELDAHSQHFESYGRDVSLGNSDLLLHWRMDDGAVADGAGTLAIIDSTLAARHGTGSGFVASTQSSRKFLEDYAYIPSIDYGWNQEKVRAFSGSRIDPLQAYEDSRLVSLEFNLYDALNEDISHIMSSYGELNDFIGLPINRYREDYEGLSQMRETYFRRLQGDLNIRVFADMLDFFDSSFVSLVERLLPARAVFRGDELVVESHMLERPKHQYQLRPVIEGRIDISGSIAVVDRGDDFD